jgi:hypothetical protein
VSTAFAFSMFGASPAAAGSSPEVVGQKYSDARGALTGAGSTVVVSTTVGDQLGRGDCVVSRQQTTMVPPQENTGGSATKQTSLSLDCDVPRAPATKTGNSPANPEGAAAAAAQRRP